MSGSFVSARLPLWSRADAVWFAVLVGTGAGLVALSWFFAAGRSDPGDQLVFLSVSLLGVGACLAAVVGSILKGRRAVGRRTRMLLGAAPVTTNRSFPVSRDLVAGPGSIWFHRADCLLAESRTWPASPRSVHEAAGRRSCPGCRP